MTKKKDLDYDKLMEFWKYPSLYKFRNTVTSIKFSDGTCMSYFWKHHKNKIKALENDISREIYEQYDEFLIMMRQMSEKRYFEKLLEFSECKSFSKFFTNDEKFAAQESTLKSFWHLHKNRILTSEDELSERVAKQYKLALKKQELMLLKTSKITSKYESINLETFLDRLNDFIDAPQEKYSPIYEISFYDGADMHNWFIRSRDRIAKYKPEIYKVLIEEYENFKEIKYEDDTKKKGDINESKK